MPQVHVCITRLWNKPLSCVLLAVNNTHTKTSLAGCDESLRSWFRAVQCKCPKHNKNYHTIPSAPLHRWQPHKPAWERVFHPKSSLPRQWPTPAPPSHAGQRQAGSGGRLFPACRHVSHETRGQEQGSCLHCLCATCRLCVVGLYSQPANTRAGNAAGMAAANGSRQEWSHVGNLKCKQSWECVACPSQALPDLAGWLVSVGFSVDGCASVERGQPSAGRGAEMNQASAEAFICNVFWIHYYEGG